MRPTIGLMIGWFAAIRVTQFVHCGVQVIL